jgi:hypothetical protein
VGVLKELKNVYHGILSEWKAKVWFTSYPQNKHAIGAKEAQESMRKQLLPLYLTKIID